MSTRPPFTRVSRRTLADDVRERLAETITSGALAPGSMIPSEETLCQEFGVSRPSVREAIRELIVLGLVERRGNRAHVVEHFPDVRIGVAEQIERVRELFETRRAIEVPLTQYAAERATAEQRAEMKVLARQIRAARNIDELGSLDQAFHSLIAASANNALLAELHGKVLEALFNSPGAESVMTTPHSAARQAQIVKASAKAHDAIAAAIVRGDGEGAAVAARTHLEEAEARIVAQSREPATASSSVRS